MSATDERWRKSSRSQPEGQNCVEVAELPGAAAVRDSMNPQRGYLTVSAPEWAAFLCAVRGGEL